MLVIGTFFSIKWHVSFSVSSFAGLRRILDAEMKEVHAAGITNAKAEKEAVSDGDEERMWQQGVLGEATAKSLLHTIYFYNGHGQKSRTTWRQSMRTECLIT